MNQRIAAAWTIGLLLAVLLVSGAIGAWVILRRRVAPAPRPDPFAFRELKLGIAGDPGPIPSLRVVPDKEKQRARQLNLLTLSFNGTLEGLLAEVRSRTNQDFTTGEVDLKKPVRIEAHAWPLLRIFNEAGVDPDDTRVLKRYSIPSATRYADGVRLSFSAKRWEPEGKTLGWILQTDGRIDLPKSRYESSLTWQVGSVEGNGPVPFETCGRHSPTLVYVANPDPGPLTVKVRGERSWFLEVPIEFQNPREGAMWKGHGFFVTLLWPKVMVRSERPFPAERLRQCLSGGDVLCYLPDGRLGGVYDTIGIGGGGGGGGRYSGRFGGRAAKYAWCGCAEPPAKVEPPDVTMADSFEVETGPHNRPLSDYKTIQLVNFRVLIHESFEVVSDPISTK